MVTLGRVLLQHLFALSLLHYTKVVYGRDPPRLLSYVPGTSRVDALDHAILECDEVLREMRTRLQQAQAQMKHSYDQHNCDLSFEPGDCLWLHLHLTDSSPWLGRGWRSSLENSLAPLRS